MAEYDLTSITTILDIAKMYNAKELLPIAEVLHKKNGLFKTAHMEEANQIAAHVMAKEKALPTGSWRGVNQGVAAGNYLTEQVVEPLSRLEGRSEIDEYLLELVPNKKEYRFKHDLAHMEGYSQSVVTAFLYGDPSDDPNKPKGLAQRYKTLGANVHDNGATSNCTSVWVVQWGEKKCGLLYPRSGAREIVKQEDMGRVFVVTDTTTGAGLFKYITRFFSILGIAIYDDRAVQRIANIGTGTTSNLDLDLLFYAMDRLPDPEDTKGTVIYVNRTTKTQLEAAVRNRPNVITMEKDNYGNRITYVRGVPIVMLEGITDTEAAVTA